MSQALQIGQYTTNASAEATIVPLKSVILVSTLPLSESSFRTLSSGLSGLLICHLFVSCSFTLKTLIGKPFIRQSAFDGPSSLALLPRPSNPHPNTDRNRKPNTGERSSFILAQKLRCGTRTKIRTRTYHDDDDDGFDHGDTGN
jgi:hypothetical protein